MKKIMFALMAAAAIFAVVSCNKDNKPEENNQNQQEEALDPAPEGEWCLIGAIASTGNNWNADHALTADGDVFTITGVQLTTADQFKLRIKDNWDINRGAEGDVEPFVVTVGTALHAVQNGKNLSVPEDGTYTIKFERLYSKITLTK